MSNFLAFLQLTVGLAALYVTIYLALKKKYEKLRELHLNINEFIDKSDKIRETVGWLNTIYIIITLIAILFYISPFKGFFQFFKGNDINTPLGKNIYTISSVISFLILTFVIIKLTFFDVMDFFDGKYSLLFCAFVYIFDIIVLLKINQFALTYYIKSCEESLINMYYNIIITHMFMDFILLILYMFSHLGYSIFIDFLYNKFTE